MATNKPRRPAQMKPEQLDLIEAKTDIPFDLEIAHATANAVVPIAGAEIDHDASERILKVIESDGIDSLAETWAEAPNDSLPGILWRGYLLAEWIHRFPQEVAVRVRAAEVAGDDNAEAPSGTPQSVGSGQEPDSSAGEDSSRGAAVPQARTIEEAWETVFRGDFTGDFAAVLADSAQFTAFIGQVQPEWIASDEHPLATLVTRRDDAIARVSAEFSDAHELLGKNLLR
ncbi:MAG: hypothetical protein PUK40_05960 [Actinomycetaceae bacterium]|nr:hypothetical protein [Arcanobacterium sp.]MDD7505474.1 hypothetical protein [Actinomycetaceae bacterium]MDY6143160.1 hypothetical protein [Arcanobacterium sp.]